ncbi:glycosyltransferase family 8 protein [bacterium]|nr:glycosyltransferase family 8 protein [bacterium]
MEKINVCLTCDDNYATYAGVTITSILKNARPEDKLAFYILDGGITEQHKTEISSLKSIKECEINFVQIEKSLFSDYQKVPTHKHLTIASFYRLKLSSLIPDVKRIIYFDCDFIICKDLNELNTLELEDNIIAGVLDNDRRKLKKNPTYINSGMIVFDLEKIRKENIEDKFLSWTKSNIENIQLGDQDIINDVLKGRIKLLQPEWNVQSSNFTNRSVYTKHPKAIHLLDKPWKYASANYYKPEYFKYLQMTPWALNEQDYKHWTVDNQRDSIIAYLKRRPLIFLRPRFYKALYKTYIER